MQKAEQSQEQPFANGCFAAVNPPIPVIRKVSISGTVKYVKAFKAQAYLAMFSFLEAEYRLSSSAEIGVLLGSMSLLPDGSPADPAVKKQWDEAIAAALGGNVDAALSFAK